MQQQWLPHQHLVYAIAGAAHSACSGGACLNIEEFDIENEVDLYNYDVQARLIYDNTTMTPVFQLLGQQLASWGYSPTVLTVSVGTNQPGISDPNDLLFNCKSIYGDSAQVMFSTQLLAATGGAKIGSYPDVEANGQMACYVGSDYDTGSMINIPTPGGPLTQATRTVTDMHDKPCLTVSRTSGDCDPNNSTAIPARDGFNAIWDFLINRGLTGNIVMLGETWSNSTAGCNVINDTVLSSSAVNGYAQSCLYSSQNSCCPDNTQYGCAPGGGIANNVVFRPDGGVMLTAGSCETPLRIGASGGPFKY